MGSPLGEAARGGLGGVADFQVGVGGSGVYVDVTATVVEGGGKGLAEDCGEGREVVVGGEN